ncbi:MAG TPA: hypothetical protein VGJ02_00790 [Pyrinomonadaceae bacterium]
MIGAKPCSKTAEVALVYDAAACGRGQPIIHSTRKGEVRGWPGKVGE